MIAVSSSGRTFAAIARYLALGRSGDAPERVAWASARNLPTNDPELAGQFMRATAAQSLTVEKPVYHLAIAFDPHDPVDRATMERVADRVLARLGLAEHEAIIVAHRDRKHPHMHLLVNRVHPTTGKAWDRWQDRPAIQQVLREEEQVLGLRRVPGRLASIPDHALQYAIPSLDTTLTGDPHRENSDGRHAFLERVRERAAAFERSPTWEALETELANAGIHLERRGAGLVITDGSHHVRASSVARELGMGQLGVKFGISYDGYRARLSDGSPSQLALIEPDVDRPRPSPVSAPLLGVGLVPESASMFPENGRSKVSQLRELLATHERVTALSEEHYRTANLERAARARVALSEASSPRLRAANAAFADGLTAVYRDPLAARELLESAIDRLGIDTVTRALRENPEQFGALVREERRRAFGLRREYVDEPARRAAGALATQARELWQARSRQVSTEDFRRGKEEARTAAARLRELQHSLRRNPPKPHLEREIGRVMRQLLPRELEELRRLVSTPQLAVARKLRDTIKDVALAREGQEH